MYFESPKIKINFSRCFVTISLKFRAKLLWNILPLIYNHASRRLFMFVFFSHQHLVCRLKWSHPLNDYNDVISRFSPSKSFSSRFLQICFKSLRVLSRHAWRSCVVRAGSFEDEIINGPYQSQVACLCFCHVIAYTCKSSSQLKTYIYIYSCFFYPLINVVVVYDVTSRVQELERKLLHLVTSRRAIRLSCKFKAATFYV